MGDRRHQIPQLSKITEALGEEMLKSDAYGALGVN